MPWVWPRFWGHLMGKKISCLIDWWWNGYEQNPDINSSKAGNLENKIRLKWISSFGGASFSDPNPFSWSKWCNSWNEGSTMWSLMSSKLNQFFGVLMRKIFGIPPSYFPPSSTHRIYLINLFIFIFVPIKPPGKQISLYNSPPVFNEFHKNRFLGESHPPSCFPPSPFPWGGTRSPEFLRSTTYWHWS